MWFGRILLAVTAASSLAVAAEPARDLSFLAYPSSPEALVAEFPTIEANGTAKEVEALAAKLGIDLVPRSIDGRSKPTPETKKAWEAVRGDVVSYVVRELESETFDVQIPPLAVDRFLTSHAETLDALRDLLVGAPHPRWDRNVENFHQAGLPNLLGHMSLQEVLIAAALASGSTGDDVEALAY